MPSKSPKQFQTMSTTITTTATSSHPPPAPSSSALPPSHHPTPHNTSCSTRPSSPAPAPASKGTTTPNRTPLLRLELRDLSSSGTHAFLRLVHAAHALDHALHAVLDHLYPTGIIDPARIPGTRSVTLVLRAMDGVAYTTGLALDDDHKEIHLNTRYVEQVGEARQKEEIMGVLVHEMVHCWQYSAAGSAPVGLTEGVADWVRLKAGYAPPHWKRLADGGEWDAGYERTAYFLAWLEEQHGEDVVPRLNLGLAGGTYDGHKLWHDCCGKSVHDLWREYKQCVEKSE